MDSDRRNRLQSSHFLRSHYLVAALVVLLSACVTPSTVMVNREGKVMRCAAHGYGNAIAIGTAQSIHDSCVNDARQVGFIPMPQAGIGFRSDTKTTPLKIIEVSPNAYAAGIREGDLLLEVDSKPIKDPFSLFQVLNTKKPGDRVGLKVQRDGAVLPLTVDLVRRQDIAP